MRSAPVRSTAVRPRTLGRTLPGAGRETAPARYAGRHSGVSLLAVAHGSRDPRAAMTVAALLAGVRRQAPGLPVSAAFLDHSSPSVGEALHEASERTCVAAKSADGRTPEVVVLPLLLTAGYHSRVDIPRAVVRARAEIGEATGMPAGERAVRYADPLGPHPLLVAALERRLSAVGVPPGDFGTAVVLVSAGSSDPSATATVEGVAAGWRARGWWDVRAAYACAVAPTVADAVRGLRRAGAPRVAVAPYLLSPGLFSDQVAADARAAGADVVADVLGAAPELVDLVLARMAAARP